MKTDHCMMCGSVIPAGLQICNICRTKYNIENNAEEKLQELKDITDVFKITDGTDKSMKKSMESMLRIADRLERKNDEEKRR